MKQMENIAMEQFLRKELDSRSTEVDQTLHFSLHKQ